MATLKIDRGTTFIIAVNYQVDGVATSLVGSTVRFTMKPVEWDSDADDSDASVKKNITDGTAEGYAEIELIPDDTDTLTPGSYYYDIKVENASGEIYKIDEGKVKLDGSPTNRLV